MFCAKCGVELKSDAKYCHGCGEALSMPAPLEAMHPVASVPATLSSSDLKQQSLTKAAINSNPLSATVKPMGAAAMRKGATQAKFNDENSGVMAFEMTVIAIAAGVITSSWWWFGGVFLGLIVAVSIKPLARVLAVLLSIGWGIIGYGIGMLFDSQPAAIVLGLLGVLCGLGLHLSAIQWFRDA